MPHWMMKFEVEGHLGVESTVPEVVFHHPNGLYEVHVRNLRMDPGVEKPLLHMFILFDADDLPSADAQGTEHLNRFLQFLSFARARDFESGILATSREKPTGAEDTERSR